MNNLISLILNSRQRKQHLCSLLSSIGSTTDNIDSIEVIVNIDSDDSEYTDSVIETISGWFSFVKFKRRERPKNLHVPINISCMESTSKLVFILNDDVLFLTDSWDKILYEKYLESKQKYTDGIFYFRSYDNSADKEHGGKYPSFPIMTRQSIIQLGYVMPEIFVGLGADVYLYRLFDKINRIIDVDIKLEHTLHASIDAVMNPDSVAADMRTNTYQNYVNPWSISINEDVHKLVYAIKQEEVHNSIIRAISE